MKNLTLGKFNFNVIKKCIYLLYLIKNFFFFSFPFIVTIPLVAWRNPSGQFVSIESNQGSLSFSNGESHGNTTVPRPDQLFLFVPHPGNYL